MKTEIIWHSDALPKGVRDEFQPIVEKASAGLGRGLDSDETRQVFWREFVEPSSPYLLNESCFENDGDISRCHLTVAFNGTEMKLVGEGKSSMAAFLCSFKNVGRTAIEVVDCHVHMLGESMRDGIIAYVCIQLSDGGTCWGAGVGTSIALAPVRAILSALNRGVSKQALKP